MIATAEASKNRIENPIGDPSLNFGKWDLFLILGDQLQTGVDWVEKTQHEMDEEGKKTQKHGDRF